MKPVHEFTIDRKVWGRGDDGGTLYNPKTEKMCCVGIYLKSLGAQEEVLAHCATASTIIHSGKALPRSGVWLVNEVGENSHEAAQLYTVNDDNAYDIEIDDQREELIARLFSKQGVRVTFEG